jgi:RimJ/RimL family protein N-acetyltransferase
MKKHESSFADEELSFRYANINDEALLLAWRNDPKVRKYSRMSDSIDLNIHAKWFSERLNVIDTQPIFIFQWKLKNVGMIRLDLGNNSLEIYEISIIVDESLQNLGFATSMILQILELAKNELLAREIRAFIHAENLHSIRLFNNLNFHKTSGEIGGFEEYAIYL